MDSFKDEEVEEILESEETEETETSEDEIVVTDDDSEEDENIEEAKDAASKLKASVSSKRASSDKSSLPAAAKSKESPKYKGLYKSVGGGAVVAEPTSEDAAGASDKQLKNVDNKRSGKSESVKVHMDAMFNGEELSEEFRTKAETIFETALNERVEVIHSEIQEEFSNKLLEQTEILKGEMTQQLDSYLSYVVEEWMEDNKLALEKGLRVEVTEEFMEGLRSLFLNHNIEVPQGKTDILDQMAEQVEAMTDALNKEINKNIELKETYSSLERKTFVSEMTDGLADTDKDRFVKLSEGVGFDNNQDFQTKLQIIRESYFEGSGKSYLAETVEDDMTAEENAPATEQHQQLSESMEAYSQMLSRLNKNSKKTI